MRAARLTLAFSLCLAACASAPERPGQGVTAHASTTASIGDAPPATPTATAHASASAAPSAKPEAPPTLTASDAFDVKQVFEGSVDFFITGEKGRMALLRAEEGVVVAHKLEAGAWLRMPLPDKARAAPSDASLGIWFGRDNRPRLMGFTGLTDPRMVYLRFKDGRWEDQRSELGVLAGEKAALFGVLGEADPEVVCRVGGICLLKSRKGWQEVENSIGPDAVVRAFGGVGYALTKDGLFRAGKKTFERVGGPAPWTTAATGFWVGEGEAALVVEPAKGSLHVLDRGATAWQTLAAPIEGPRDVVGPRERALVVGDGGAAHDGPSGWRRVGAADLRLHRVIDLGPSQVIAGASGVFTLSPR